MAIVFEKPKALSDLPFHYCPGCPHGIIHRLVAEVMDELGIEGKTIGVAPVGCAVMAYDYFNCDMIEAAHGRAPAVATGIKRCRPDNIVFTYQGDGDLAPDLMATAEYVTKVHAICVRCGNLAHHSHRLTADNALVMLGEKDTYEPICRHCFAELSKNEQ